jgi:hypothetical protein
MPWPNTGLKRQRASPVASSPAGKRLQALEMPPYAARQLEADDICQRPGVPDRVKDGRGAQAPDEIHESRAVARRHIAMIASDGKQPSLLLDRKQERSAAAGRCGRQDDITQPVGIVIVRPLEDGARVSLINADLGFFGPLERKLFEHLQRQAAAAGSFNYQVGFQRHSATIFNIVTDRLDSRCITRCDKLGHTGAHANADVRRLLNASPGNGFEQWARHAENIETEIANGEWVEPGALEPDVLPGTDPHSTGFRQILLKSRKQCLQSLQPAREQRVAMLALRCPSSRRRFHGKHIPLDHRDFPEMPGDRLSGRKAGHAGADHHGMTSCRIRHVLLLTASMSRPALMLRAAQAYLILPGTMVKGLTSWWDGDRYRPSFKKVCTTAPHST